MTSPRIISDSSPLIALARINRLDLLRLLFGSILVPPAVVQEIGPALALLPWIEEYRLARHLDPRVQFKRLGDGEREALSLALELSHPRLIVDDLPARHLAQSLNIPIIGTVGVLLAAKHQSFLAAIRPELHALRATGFRMRPELLDETLARAGESD